MNKENTENLNSYFITFIIILFSILQRWCVSLSPYSGAGKPPMFGDYEAQRHWMEITLHLPVSKWYVDSDDNDLQYWGLDYPPLTAYHSKVCGIVANLINPDWVALNKSRGYESYDHKLFMRYSVLFVDVFIYIGAMICFVNSIFDKRKLSLKSMSLLVLLSYPGLILIDHGHFQYNCVSLGYTLFAIYFILNDAHLIGSTFFVLSLNYKQMSLYHAFPFFFYLLGVSFKQATWSKRIFKLASIGSSVVVMFLICWLPFLYRIEDAVHVLQRLFPFNRGLYEDKVANIWCSLSVVFKLKAIFDQAQMVKLCMVSTLVACLPSCINLLIYPTKKKFIFSLASCSLAFFLFSYQVHEKSILIVALPVLLLIFHDPFICTWFLLISTFSMFPLLVRDGQSFSYFALIAIFIVLSSWLSNVLQKGKHMFIKVMGYVSFVGAVMIHIAFATIQPPAKLPDLFPLLYAVYSCAHFLLFFIYLNYEQFKCLNSDKIPLYEIFDGKRKLKSS